ncbi:hypothetical protein ACLOJK_034473, partial [Asimina triloba]
MQATIPINACCRPSPPEAAAITARDDADARTRIHPSPPAHHRLARLPPRHRLAANCPPFCMSARSAWACRAHSEPRRCRHHPQSKMPPQLQCPHRSESPINRCIRA